MSKKEENEEIQKITVTKDAGDVLNEILLRVNEGFDAGKVNRQDIASWIILKFKKSFTDSEIQLIRKEFFSEKALLEAILKNARGSGEIPEFLRDALKRHWTGALESPRRPAKNPLNQKLNAEVTQLNIQNGVENGKIG